MQSVPPAISRRLWWLLAGAVALVALASSGIGILNGFAYDDEFVIVHATTIDALAPGGYPWWKIFTWPYWLPMLGGDGYRPLTILLFGAEWLAGGGSPMPFHAVNIAVYIATSVAVFWLASQLLPIAYAACSAALFAAHPVHVEAVANAVGQSEVVVGMFAVTIAALYIRWRNRDVLDTKRMVALGAMYFTACFAKEHAIVIPALLAAAECFVVETREPLRARAVRLRPFVLALAALGLTFLLIRSLVLPSVTGFQLYVPFQVEQVGTLRRVATMVGLVPVWTRLFLWPAHLRSEYGPPEFPMADGLRFDQLPGALILMAVLGLIVAARRRAPAVSFGLCWMIIALLPASNFLIPTGILIAERTLFLPSVGVMIVVGATMPAVATRLRAAPARRAAFAALIAVVVAGIARSHQRTQVWHDNEVLFTTAVADAPNSYRTHYVLGGWRFGNKRLREGEGELRIALRLYPNEPYMTYNLGEEYRKAGLYPAAITMFERVLELLPGHKDSLGRMAMCLAGMGRLPEARTWALKALAAGSRERVAMHDIIVAGAAAQRAADAAAGPRNVPDPAQNAGKKGGVTGVTK
jgi:Flp pilus assembly protein TadD